MAYQSLGDRFREQEDSVYRPPNPPVPPEEQTSVTVPLADLYKPFSKVASEIILGNPTTTTYGLGSEVFNNPTDKIKIRKVNLEDLGSAGKLGKGDFILESLYDVNHRNNPDRESKFTRPGMGNLGGLDIKGYSSNEITYRGPDRGDEPYFINPIGSEDDPSSHKSRIIKFYKSPAGISAVLKENFTNLLYRRANQKYGIDKIVFPAVPALGSTATQLAGLGLGVGQADAYVNDLGNTIGSLRNIFRIEYSKRHNFGLPFAKLGDDYKPLTEGFEFFEDLSTNSLGLDVTSKRLDAKSDGKYKLKKKLDWILEKTPDVNLTRIKKSRLQI